MDNFRNNFPPSNTDPYVGLLNTLHSVISEMRQNHHDLQMELMKEDQAIKEFIRNNLEFAKKEFLEIVKSNDNEFENFKNNEFESVKNDINSLRDDLSPIRSAWNTLIKSIVIVGSTTLAALGKFIYDYIFSK